MSLQIILAHPELEEASALHSSLCCSELLAAPHVIPPAPPLSLGGFSKKSWRRESPQEDDDDSGCGSFAENSFFDDLPGCNVSDSEFRESFAVSRASSSRSSWSHDGLTITEIAVIPEPPPLPPLQFFIPRFATAPLANDPGDLELEIMPRRIAFPRNLSFDSDVSSLFGTLRRVPRTSGDAESGESYYQTSPGTCIVCYDTDDEFLKLSCCGEITCQPCLATMIRTRLEDGLIEFPCPNPECSDPVSRTEALRHLDAEEKARYERLRVNAEGDGTRKTCPHCSHITEHRLPRTRRLGRRRQLREEEVKITCENCRIEWCFQCHAPWHSDMTCKNFMRGNKQFRKWTQGCQKGIANCQKCPTCRVFIQRSTGCDHMTCNRCSTHFCYKCGGSFVEIPGVGSHYQRMSVFGCRYNYLAEDPVKRKVLRGGYFGAKMAALTGYPILFVGGVVVLVVAGAVALPIYGGYRYYKFKKNTNRMRRRRRH